MPNASLTIDGTEIISKENGVVSLKNTNADTSLSFPANHAGIKTALNASGDAPVYACRAWVNFDGTTNTAGFCTIRGSGNVSSITDNNTGYYTVNFTTPMPDTNYSVSGSVSWNTESWGNTFMLRGDNYLTSSVGFMSQNNQDSSSGWILNDAFVACVQIFR